MRTLLARFHPYKHLTNAMGLAFVAFYLVSAISTSNGNHIYNAFQLFPALAAAAIAQSMWVLPDNSLWRIPHLMGCFFVSWLV